MRGLQRSRTIESLIAEAKALESQGVSELVLISQDTTRYGEDLGMKRKGLALLVERLLAETSFPWIRFLYAYPKTLDDSVLDVMARDSRFVPYVDIPLQHVSRPILSKMKRGGDPASYLAMIARMREKVPAIAIRTTFIVGFPGEGQDEFRALCEFVRAAEFDNLGAFTYSPEPGSASEPLGDGSGRREEKRKPSSSPSSRSPGRSRSLVERGRGNRGRSLRGDRAPPRGTHPLPGSRNRRPAPHQRHRRPERLARRNRPRPRLRGSRVRPGRRARLLSLPSVGAPTLDLRPWTSDRSEA
jgi:hypothetical protein